MPNDNSASVRGDVRKRASLFIVTSLVACSRTASLQQRHECGIGRSSRRRFSTRQLSTWTLRAPAELKNRKLSTAGVRHS